MSSHPHQQHQLIPSANNTPPTIMSATASGNVAGHHISLVDHTTTTHVMHHANDGHDPSQQIDSSSVQATNDRITATASQQPSLSIAVSSSLVSHQASNPHRSASTGSDLQFRSLVEQPLLQPHQVIYSLADHIDDDNDLFECGKCKQNFSYLHAFLQHKKLCNNRKTEKLRRERELAEIELHLGIASSSQHMIHSGHSLGKSLLSSSSANSSPLLIQSTNNSPTSMLNIAGAGGSSHTNPLAVDVNHRLNHHKCSSPLDPLNGSAMNVNSILPDNDLLSLASSLDANMIASIGNSISPSSLLHLQGGDVSSNTDDFAQFAHLNHIDQSTDTSINEVHQVQSRAASTGGLYGNPSSNGMLNSLTSSTSSSISTSAISVSSHHHLQSQQSSMNVINFMNSINTSPTSFASFIQNISSTEVMGSGSSLLKTPFDGDVDTTSNDNSIGSPSRFLNLPPPSSTPSTPSSIIEHRPNQSSSTVRSTQTSSETQQSHGKNTATLNVIHHPQQQPIMINQHNQESSTQESNQTNNSLGTSRTLVSNEFLDSQQQQQQTPANNPAQTSTTHLIEQFKCTFCQRSFAKSSELANHLPCHTGEKPYQCCICGKAFGQKNNLRKHIITHKVSKEQYQNAYRTSLDQSLKNMPIGNKKHKSPKLKQTDQSETVIYICPMKCGVTSESLQSLQAHCDAEHQMRFADNSTTVMAATETINNDHASNPQSVSSQQISQMVNSSTVGDPPPSLINSSQNITNSDFSSSTCLVQIKQEITDGNLATVNYVSSPTNPPSQQQQPAPPPPLPQPLKIQDEFVCPMKGCGFISTKETEFKMHCVDHTVANDENIRYRCTANDCQEVYNNIETYIKHLQSHDRALCNSESEQRGSNGGKGRSRIFRCQTCLNRYTTQNALENHKATTSHHYPCQHCNKVFPCERYLRRHLLTHGAGLFSCTFCDKSFKTANYLKVHLIIHTGEKPFSCKICDAAFNRRDKLKRHELVHDPVKRYKCPMNSNGCKREFNRPDKLKAHILTHSGVKPYQCSLCNRSFTRRAHLREHGKTHQDLVDAINKANTAKSHLKVTDIDGINQISSINRNNQVMIIKKDEVKKEELAKNQHANESSNLQTCFSNFSNDSMHQKQNVNSNDENLLFDKDGSSSSLGPPELKQSSLDNSNQSNIQSSNVPSQQQSDPKDQNSGSIILFTGSRPSNLPSQTSSIDQVIPEISGTTSIIQPNIDSSVKITNTQQTISNTSTSSTNSSTGFQAFIILYSCPKCETCFLKEEELKEHKCLGRSDKSPADRNNNPEQQQGRTILLPINTSDSEIINNNADNNNDRRIINTAAATTTTTAMAYTFRKGISENSSNNQVQIKTENVFDQN